MKAHPFSFLPALLTLLAVTFTQSATFAYSLEEDTTNSLPTNKLEKQIASHIKARMDALHFKPAIKTASNAQCLQCHQEILQRKPRDVTLAGVKTKNTLAWYQTVDTYQGEQDTFHRRHMRHLLAEPGASPVLMRLNCNTCHQGHNINKEVTSDVHRNYSQPAMSKEVDPNTCLMCHGKFDYNTMPGVVGPWSVMAASYNNDCMMCHRVFRTNAHDVNYLNKEVITQAGTANGEVCYGCHGGRSWYGIAYPYPRNTWLGMSPIIPEWAKNRPTTSQPRFLIGIDKADQE